MTFTVEYQREAETSPTIIEGLDRVQAEMRAKQISRKFAGEELLVYVLRGFPETTGARSYYHGRTDSIEGDYLD